MPKEKSFKPPRTSAGQPDLQGLWEASTTTGGQSIEAYPRDSFGFRATTSMVVEPADGKVPYQPWAVAERKENLDRYTDPYGMCFPAGVPRQMYLFRTRSIVQRSGDVTIVNEAGGHIYRVIPTDGRPHLGKEIKLWMGDSRGRWEGNTLVVDVTNFTDKTWFDVLANFHSDAMHVVERFTLVDGDTIHYEATIDDPKVYTRPWKLAFPLVRNKEPGYEQMEEACHEGNNNRAGLLSLYKIYSGIRR